MSQPPKVVAVDSGHVVKTGQLPLFISKEKRDNGPSVVSMACERTISVQNFLKSENPNFFSSLINIFRDWICVRVAVRRTKEKERKKNKVVNFLLCSFVRSRHGRDRVDY